MFQQRPAATNKPARRAFSFCVARRHGLHGFLMVQRLHKPQDIVAFRGHVYILHLISYDTVIAARRLHAGAQAGEHKLSDIIHRRVVESAEGTQRRTL